MKPLPKFHTVTDPEDGSDGDEYASALPTRRDRLIEWGRSGFGWSVARRRALVVIAALLALCLGLSAWIAVSRHATFDGGFEQNLAGWSVKPSSATVDRVRGGHSGEWSAKVVNTASQATTTTLRNSSAPKTQRGQSYEARAWVRATTPGITINLRLLEWQGGKRGKAEKSIQLRDTKWRQIEISYVAARSGSTLLYNLFAWKLQPDQGFLADDLQVGPQATGTTGRASAQAQSPVTPRASATRAPTLNSSVHPVGGGSGWREVWTDEFNEASLDTSKWTAENESTFGDSGEQLSCLMAGDRNLRLKDGRLDLIAQQEHRLSCGKHDTRFPIGRSYSSALISSKGKADWKYGWFEMRAQLPTGPGNSKGMWPAFWMRPAVGSLGELDIMEAMGSGANSGEADKIHQTIWYDYTGAHPQQSKTVTVPSGQPSDGFHVYAVDWEPTYIKWYVDGVLTYERTDLNTTWLREAFTQPQYLRLNLAVGGRFSGDPDLSTAFPATYSIDYVRVFQR